jgi:hypothetical protein
MVRTTNKPRVANTLPSNGGIIRHHGTLRTAPNSDGTKSPTSIHHLLHPRIPDIQPWLATDDPIPRRISHPRRKPTTIPYLGGTFQCHHLPAPTTTSQCQLPAPPYTSITSRAVTTSIKPGHTATRLAGNHNSRLTSEQTIPHTASKPTRLDTRSCPSVRKRTQTEPTSYSSTLAFTSLSSPDIELTRTFAAERPASSRYTRSTTTRKRTPHTVASDSHPFIGRSLESHLDRPSPDPGSTRQVSKTAQRIILSRKLPILPSPGGPLPNTRLGTTMVPPCE